jgi:pantoate--beta-alanine ligase
MRLFDTIPALRSFIGEEKAAGRRISFVPTMGALHEGHKSCVDIARRHGDVLVVSIFVNPTQFGPKEDFKRYPRDLERDAAALREWDCDVLFAPSTEEMYPDAQSTWVEVEKLTDVLCGAFRPGHFRGVTTVVTKLFNIVEPHVAVFGQKDAQQALVIKRMVEQLDFPVKIILSPIVRERDGLAVSSRNAYLSGEERTRAAAIYRGLQSAKALLARGERASAKIVGEARKVMEDAGIADIEYVELLDARDLSRLETVEGRVILAVAARIGGTRLIDNVVLEVGESVEEAALF